MNKLIDIPKGALNIIELLHKSGYESYLVGGCVRDMLLGKQPKDWDICTNATPDEVKVVANTYGIGTVDTGIKFGTVSLVMGGRTYEVTTYRADSDNTDGRKPENVTYVKTLREDVVRRDLTINALAYDIKTDKVIDFVGGVADLQNGVIRFVGDTQKRLSEDYLRALRAIRFKIVYGFSMSDTDLNLCKDVYLHHYKDLSNERIHGEFDNMLIGCKSIEDIQLVYSLLANSVVPELTETYNCEQNNKYHKHDVASHIMNVVLNVENTLELRWSALLHDIGKPLVKTTNDSGDHFIGHPEVSARIAMDVLYRLHYSRSFIDEIIFLVSEHNMFSEGARLSVLRRFIGVHGAERMRKLTILMVADKKDHNFSEQGLALVEKLRIDIKQILEEKSNFTLKDLKINGNDLKNLGETDGKRIGAILEYLLNNCYGSPSLNNKEWLFKEATKQIRKHQRTLKTNKMTSK